jgi:hypothetical protein
MPASILLLLLLPPLDNHKHGCKLTAPADDA